jgi:hypothetical protein
MGFTQNNTLGRGRKAGSLNKTTISIKQNFQTLIEDNLELLDSDLKSLTPKDRIKAITELAKFVVPTMKQVEAEVTSVNNLTWIDQFSESDLQKLLNN